MSKLQWGLASYFVSQVIIGCWAWRNYVRFARTSRQPDLPLVRAAGDLQ